MDLPSYLAGPVAGQPVGDFQPVRVTDPFDPRTDAIDEDSDLSSALEVSQENIDRFPHATRVSVDAIRRDLFDEPGWSLPGGGSMQTQGSTSSGTADAGPDTRQGSLVEVLGQTVAGAGGAVVAVVVGIVAALAWGLRDG